MEKGGRSGKKDAKAARNILGMVPFRNRDYPATTDLATGHISIDVPRFKGRLGRGFCEAFRIKQDIRITLDDYGSLVWTAIDGKKTVREIGNALRTRFGPKVEPLYSRLAYFLSLLERNKLISYRPVKVHRAAVGKLSRTRQAACKSRGP